MSKILIYDDGVTSRYMIQYLENSLRYKVSQAKLHSVIVERIHPEIIRQNDSWHQETVLFCLPGGRSRDFREHLKQEGNDSIRRYVNAGGTFAGFCAGAYHAAKSIDFDYETDHIRDLSGLGLFPGKCVGPIKQFIPYFDAVGIVSARLVNIKGSHEKSEHYQELYWGGPQFIFDKKSNPQIKIHYCYTSFEENNAAVVSFPQGQGNVFLSSPHIEIQREDFLKYCEEHLPKTYRKTIQERVGALFRMKSLRAPALDELFKLCHLGEESFGSLGTSLENLLRPSLDRKKEIVISPSTQGNLEPIF